MRLTLTRSGGFAGIRRPPIVVDTTKLPDARAQAGNAALAAAGFFDLPAQISGEPKPDRFGYALKVEHDDGRKHEVSFGEADASKELLVLTKWIESTAKSTSG